MAQEKKEIKIGAHEPPQDWRIFNRRMADGTVRKVSEFFKKASEEYENVKSKN